MMELPAAKGSLPFKTMDIKAAFQNKMASQARKRKASQSEELKIDSKTIKLSNNCEGENEIETIKEDVRTKSPIPSLQRDLGDGKENTDLNILDENNGFSEIDPHSKDNLVKDISVTDSSIMNISSDELNSSALNSSVLNSTLDISVSTVSDDQGEAINESIDTSVETPGGNDDKKSRTRKTSRENQNDSAPKKKKKMSPEEAKLKAEEHEKKLQEKEDKRKVLEAKRLEKQQEKAQRQKERERILIEKQMRKEEEEEKRKERERLKQEKKEQEEKEKQEKIKEREIKIQLKQMTMEAKLEEKKKKEEQKQKQLEEKKKAEEEKKKAEIEKEQKEKEKREKAKAHFFSFFVKKNECNVVQPVSQPSEKEGGFLPFQVSDDMILAPVVPAVAQERFDKEQLDNFLKHQGGTELYLQNLKSGYKSVKIRKKDKKVSTCEAEVILVEQSEQTALGLRAKLFQFSENVRPPYWGTWRKTSKTVHSRNPFRQDEIFDYTVDSDDEWDEGGPGESLSGTEDEESDDDYEVDNEFFVPHGYLSAEEEENEDSPASNDPEMQKAVLKIKLQEFEKERKKKTTELKPVILGCYIENDGGNKDGGLAKFLESYAAELLTETPISTSFDILLLSDSKSATPHHPSDASSPLNDGSAKVHKRPVKTVPEEAMPFLIQLLHSNTNGRRIIIKEFQEFWLKYRRDNAPAVEIESKTDLASSPMVTPKSNTPISNNDSMLSKRQIDTTIQQISSYGKSPNPAMKKYCWWVNQDALVKYDLLNVPVPNKWEYVSRIEVEETVPVVAKLPKESIKQFLNP